MNKLQYLIPYLVDKFSIDKKGCWLWERSLNNKGYPVVGTSVNYKLVRALAHRVSYTAFKGEIPDNKTLDHLCKVTRCINPNHLEPVTHQENCKRGTGSKTHCKNGHKYTEKNTLYRQREGRGIERSCRVCRDIRNRERYKKLD